MSTPCRTFALHCMTAPPPGALILLLGDLLEEWTGGVLRVRTLFPTHQTPSLQHSTLQSSVLHGNRL